jgi:hypothetical protein
LLLVGLLALAGTAAHATISLDATANTTWTANTNPATMAFTVGNNTNRVLAVAVSAARNGLAAPTSATWVVGAATQNFTLSVNNVANAVSSSVYVLLAPTVGAGTITVNFANNMRTGALVATSWYDCRQALPAANETASFQRLAASALTTLTATTTASVPVGSIGACAMASLANGTAWTVTSANTTLGLDANLVGAGNNDRAGSATTTAPTAAAGTMNMAFTQVASTDKNMAFVAIRPAPWVTNVTSTLANSSYGVGQVVPITVTFSEAVTYTAGTGVAQLQLETGTTDRQAAYSSGSGTTALIFNYTVQVGDTSADLEYLSTAALTLTGTATLRSSTSATTNAVLTLPALAGTGSLGFNKAIVIDAVQPIPTVTGPASPSNASPINFIINFGESVTGLTAAGITVTNGTKGALSGSGSGPYTLPVTPTADGAVTCQVTAGAAQDAAGNGNTISNNLSITSDRTAPSATVTGPSSPSNASPINFTFNLVESVTGLTAA